MKPAKTAAPGQAKTFKPLDFSELNPMDAEHALNQLQTARARLATQVNALTQAREAPVSALPDGLALPQSAQGAVLACMAQQWANVGQALNALAGAVLPQTQSSTGAHGHEPGSASLDEPDGPLIVDVQAKVVTSDAAQGGQPHQANAAAAPGQADAESGTGTGTGASASAVPTASRNSPLTASANQE